LNSRAGIILALALTLSASSAARAQNSVPDLKPIAAAPQSELRDVVNRFSADWTSVTRRYDASKSPDQRQRMRSFYADWSNRLKEIDFDKLSHEGRIDFVLLDREIKHEQVLLERQETQRKETVPLLPFADRLLAMHDARRDLAPIDSRAAAGTLAAVVKQIDSLRAAIESPKADSSSKKSGQSPRVSRTVANRAANDLDAMKRIMGSWYRYYDGYDPTFTWWMKDPYKKLDDALTRYARTLRERIVGFKSTEGQSGANTGPIVGDPIGRKGLEEELAYEMIPYTPEELIAIAQREYAFSAVSR
jgi:hypothetical protein